MVLLVLALMIYQYHKRRATLTSSITRYRSRQPSLSQDSARPPQLESPPPYWVCVENPSFINDEVPSPPSYDSLFKNSAQDCGPINPACAHAQCASSSSTTSADHIPIQLEVTHNFDNDSDERGNIFHNRAQHSEENHVDGALTTQIHGDGVLTETIQNTPVHETCV